MAIIVEEEKTKKYHLFSIAGWLALLVVAGVAVFYIFFAQPEATILPAIGGLNAIAPLTQSAVQPQEVTNSAVLQGLYTTIAAPTSTGPAVKGRTNPFIAP